MLNDTNFNEAKGSSSSHTDLVLPDSCRSANRNDKQDRPRWKMVASFPLVACTHSPASGIHTAMLGLLLKVNPLKQVVWLYDLTPTDSETHFKPERSIKNQ